MILLYYFNIIFFFGVLFPSDQIPGDIQKKAIIIKGALLHTVSDGVLENMDLLFEDGRIVLIDENISINSELEVINAVGQHVFPGLISAISTLGLQEIGAVRATRDYAEVGELNPNVRANVSYNTDSEIIPI